MLRLLLVAGVLALAQCSRLPLVAEPHILGGRNVKIDEYPYMASVILKYDHACGGVILSATKVLTKASCLTPDASSPDWHSVRVGSTSIHRGGQHISAYRVDQHPNYQRIYLEYNVGMITLEKPILLGERLKTQAVVLASRAPVVGEKLTFTGFGWTKINSDIGQALQVIQVPVYDTEKCKKEINQFMDSNISENIFCAGVNGTNFYDGDDGGPIVNEKRELVGIALAHARREEALITPGIYLNTTSPSIRDFINEYIDL